jgi:hypothetical protein
LADVQDHITEHTSDLRTLLGGGARARSDGAAHGAGGSGACTFPATGQKTCFDSFGAQIPCAGTGQDGATLAGATLSYTDNGDGTISDNNTGLMWEKKSDDGSIHDKDALLWWSEALVLFTVELNDFCQNDSNLFCGNNGDADCGAVGGHCGFAGYRDWRIPNAKELFGIVDHGGNFPTIDPIFHSNCVPGCTVTTCSCTLADPATWTSTTYRPDPSLALHVAFFGGFMYDPADKGIRLAARAVRGGQ